MSYDPGTHTEIYQIVSGNIQAHPVVMTTTEKLCAEGTLAASDTSVSAQKSASVQQQRPVICLDRKELRREGCAVHEASGKTFYLCRVDALEQA